MIEFGVHYLGDVFEIGYKVKGGAILKDVRVALEGPTGPRLPRVEGSRAEGDRVFLTVSKALAPTAGEYLVEFLNKFVDGSERSIEGRFEIVECTEVRSEVIEKSEEIIELGDLFVDVEEAAKFEPLGHPGFKPPKPKVALHVELGSAEELHDVWASKDDRYTKGIAIEPKHNGFRALTEKKGSKVKIWTEGTEGTDRSGAMPNYITDILKDIDDDFVLDCSMGIERNGKLLPRVKLATLLSKKPKLEDGDVVVFFIFDIPYWKDDLTTVPFEKRRKGHLEDFFRRYLRSENGFQLSPIKYAHNEGDLKKAVAWASKELGGTSEGCVAKILDSPYSTKGGTDDWSKTKTVAELKVQVIERNSTKANYWNYDIGLLPSANYVGKKEDSLVPLGATLNTTIKANPGDILTIHLQELIPKLNEEGKVIDYGIIAAVVDDIDTARTKPYTTAVAESITARCGGVLQKQLTSPEVSTPTFGPGALDAFPRAICVECKSYKGGRCTDPEGEHYGQTPSDTPACGKFRRRGVEVKAEEIFKFVVRRGGKWCVAHSGNHRPGATIKCFPTKEEALAMHSAIMMHKEEKEALEFDVQIPSPAYPIPIPSSLAFAVPFESIEKQGGRSRFDVKVGDKGRFIIQTHSTSLEEEDIDAFKGVGNYDQWLAACKKQKGENAHEDWRIDVGKDYWIGFESAHPGGLDAGSPLVGKKKGDKTLVMSFKLHGRDFDWMDKVGVNKPYIAEPGKTPEEGYQPGAAPTRYGVLFQIDKGKIEFTKADPHAIEFVITGTERIPEGVWQLNAVPFRRGERTWQLSFVREAE